MIVNQAERSMGSTAVQGRICYTSGASDFIYMQSPSAPASERGF